MIPPMNNTPLLTGILTAALLLAAGGAAAQSANLAGYGYVTATADAAYAVDHEAVVDDADEARAHVEAEVRGQLDETLSVVEETKGSVEARASAGVSGAENARGGLMAGLTTNLRAFADWVQGIWAKPHVDAKSDTLADATSIAHGDVAMAESGLGGTLDLGAATDLESTARLDHHVPEPPKPKLDFLSSMQAAFSAFLGIGGGN